MTTPKPLQKFDSNHPTNCPLCDANLLGDPIPDNIKQHYSGTHWKREIGIYCRDRDRTVEYKCPDCHGRFK